MKAIQIKYLGPTNTRGSRLKAFTDAGSMTEAVDYTYSIKQQAETLAARYVKKQQWQSKITGFGCLPNGDYVATIG
jgi:hypothetical protein